MSSDRRPIVMPDLGMGPSPLRLGVWLVAPGEEVWEGDRLVEIEAANVTVDLPAPVSGSLARRLVHEGEPVLPGQILGWIATPVD